MPRQSTVRFPVSKRRGLKTVKNTPRVEKNKENDAKNYGDSKPVEGESEKLASVQCQLFASPEKKVRFDDSLNFSAENASRNGRQKSLYMCKQETSSLQKAKGVLHTGMPSKLVGREKEIFQISDFLTERLSQRKSGSLYISGAPGTGKTTCLTHVLESLNAEFCSVFINCMSVTTTAGIYRKIACGLGLGEKITSKSVSELEKYIVTFKSMVVLILDEIDQLDSKGQEVLYQLFEWPQLPNSSVLLIGIANALDLTDRILPRLHIFRYQPELLHFQPYSREQIIAILEDRLSSVQNGDNIVIKPAALQLCARKIAACTGDIRKALEVCRRAIEIVENEARRQYVLQCTSDDRCNEGSPRKRFAPVTKYVDLHQINAVLQQVYGSRIKNSSTSSDSVTLPLQQKILLCTLSLIVKNCKSTDFTLGRLHDTYRRVCKKQQVSEVDEGEFQSLCGLIESRGFIELKSNKIARLSKFVLKIDENEIVHVLQDQTLLSSILCDKSVINKRS